MARPVPARPPRRSLNPSSTHHRTARARWLRTYGHLATPTPARRGRNRTQGGATP